MRRKATAEEQRLADARTELDRLEEVEREIGVLRSEVEERTAAEVERLESALATAWAEWLDLASRSNRVRRRRNRGLLRGTDITILEKAMSELQDRDVRILTDVDKRAAEKLGFDGVDRIQQARRARRGLRRSP